MEDGFHLTPKYPPSNLSHLINFGTPIPNKVRVRRAAIAVFLVALLLFVYREMSRDVVIIDPFSVAKRFEESGLTPEAVANHIGDALQQVQTATKTSLKKDVLSLLRDEGSILPQNRNVQRDPNGYVTLRRFDGVWWFVDGEGRRFFSLGVDCLGDCTGNVEPAMDPERRKKTVALVRAWGFNTAGSWSHPSFLPDLYFAPQIYAHLEHHRTDFFDPRTWERERKAAESEVRPFAGNKMLLGYFLENENGWDPAPPPLLPLAPIGGTRKQGPGFVRPGFLPQRHLPAESGVGHPLPGFRLPPEVAAAQGLALSHAGKIPQSLAQPRGRRLLQRLHRRSTAGRSGPPHSGRAQLWPGQAQPGLREGDRPLLRRFLGQRLRSLRSAEAQVRRALPGHGQTPAHYRVVLLRLRQAEPPFAAVHRRVQPEKPRRGLPQFRDPRGPGALHGRHALVPMER